MRRGLNSNKDWSLKVKCPECESKFVIYRENVYLEKSKKDESILVSVVDCIECDKQIVILNIPPNILEEIKGVI